jgi:hypothetical protein
MDAEQSSPLPSAEVFARVGDIQQVGLRASTIIKSPSQPRSPVRPLLSDRQAQSAATQSP